MSQLRKALAASGDGAEIVTRRRGYELRVGPDAVDAGRFERLVAGGAPREALALWRGPPLDDVADEPFAGAEIRRLEELRLAALELAIEHDLEEGRHREVVGELEALVAAEPLRERLHAQRMLALYRCGRQADALAAYRQARTALVEAIGAEPGAELRRLHEAILRQDPSLELPAAVELPPELDAGTPLAGRDADLEWLRELWRGAHGGVGRLVLVTGPRGIGKTRLAAALAGEVHRDRGAVLYASGAGAPDAALAALARAGAAPRPTLLVLDDVDRAGEAVLAALDELAGRLAALPVLVLATAEDAQLRADSTLCLGPLDAAAVRAVAELYAATSEEAAAAAERLLQRERRGARSRCIAWPPSRRARRRRGVSTPPRAARRPSARACGRPRTSWPARWCSCRRCASAPSCARSTPEPVACPFKGLASFDDRRRRVLLRARAARGRDGRPPRRCAVDGDRRAVGQRQVLGAARGTAARAGRRRAARQRALGARAAAPGRASAARARAGDRRRRSARTAASIAVDQFEETFTACGDETERAAFVDALIAAARDPRRRTLVLVAVRADFYGRCASYPELWRLLGANQAPVGPMSRDELRRAIELPAQRAGLRVEPELVDALIADVEGEPGALPLLSTALLELWQQRDGRRMRLSAYRQSGGVHRAVARLAERAYERLDPAATGDGTADPAATRGRGRGRRGRAPARAAVRARGRRRGRRALRPRRRPAGHDRRGRGRGRARGAAARVAATARLARGGRPGPPPAPPARRRRARVGRRRPRPRRALPRRAAGRGARLVPRHADDLNAAEHAFLAASRAAGRALPAPPARRARGRRHAARARGDRRRGRARPARPARATRRPRPTRSALGARALLEPELDRSLLLARQGVALDDTVETRGSLLAALLQSPAAIGVIRPTGQSVLSVALSPDDRTLAVGDDSGTLVFYDARTRRRLAHGRAGRRSVRETRMTSASTRWPSAPTAGGSPWRRARRRDQKVAVASTRARTVSSPDSTSRASARWTRSGTGRRADARRGPDRRADRRTDRTRAELLRFDARTGRRLDAPVEIGVARPQSTRLRTSSRSVS